MGKPQPPSNGWPCWAPASLRPCSRTLRSGLGPPSPGLASAAPSVWSALPSGQALCFSSAPPPASALWREGWVTLPAGEAVTQSACPASRGQVPTHRDQPVWGNDGCLLVLSLLPHLQFEGRKYCEHDFQMLFAPCCGACGKAGGSTPPPPPHTRTAQSGWRGLGADKPTGPLQASAPSAPG